MEEKYCLNLPPNNKEISLTKFSHKGWDFYSHSENMMNSKDLDILIKNKDENKLHINHLPEIFYGFNRLFLINKTKNFCYEFNPLQMLSLANYTQRKKLLKEKEIYYIPNQAKSQYSKTDDTKNEEDWSFSSPYMGHITSINISPMSKYYPEIKETKVFKKEKTNLKYPETKVENVLNYNQIHFFEDELGDIGFSEGKIGFGVMNECFLGLMRCYLRVDNMVVRNIDTKIYHKFGDNYIIRNFLVKEKTYDELANKGFHFSNQWNLSPTQSDMVAPFLGDPIFEITDLVYL
jgi:type 2A phosphatase activator TIP41